MHAAAALRLETARHATMCKTHNPNLNSDNASPKVANPKLVPSRKMAKKY